jgi:hypothetical protein
MKKVNMGNDLRRRALRESLTLPVALTIDVSVCPAGESLRLEKSAIVTTIF